MCQAPLGTGKEPQLSGTSVLMEVREQASNQCQNSSVADMPESATRLLMTRRARPCCPHSASASQRYMRHWEGRPCAGTRVCMGTGLHCHQTSHPVWSLEGRAVPTWLGALMCPASEGGRVVYAGFFSLRCEAPGDQVCRDRRGAEVAAVAPGWVCSWCGVH